MKALRPIAASLVAILLIGSSIAIAGAQSWAPVGAPTAFIPPLPPIQCSAFALGGGPNGVCQTLMQQIQEYNGYANAYNQIITMNMQVVRYPYRVYNDTMSDFQQIEKVIQNVENVSWVSANTDAQIKQIWPNMQTTVDPGVLDHNLANTFINTVRGALQTDHLLEGQRERDATLVDQIQTAAQSAQSPAQLNNLEVQLLSIMWQSLQRMERLQSEKMNMEVSTSLADHAAARARTEAQQNSLQALANELNPSIPKQGGANAAPASSSTTPSPK